MPSRNNVANDCDEASLAPNDTGCSPNSFSAMWPQRPDTNGKHNGRGRSGLSSTGYEKVKVWLPAFPMPQNGTDRHRTTKKSRRCRRLKVITGRRQTEWTGATRCPEVGRPSNKGESLIKG